MAVMRRDPESGIAAPALDYFALLAKRATIEARPPERHPASLASLRKFCRFISEKNVT
jgi:hypothetical protein